MIDWTEQWDSADVCEMCGNLTAEGNLGGRLSLAITTLYTHGVVTDHERDKMRINLSNMKKEELDR